MAREEQSKASNSSLVKTINKASKQATNKTSDDRENNKTAE
jgi:hypothetical protein